MKIARSLGCRARAVLAILLLLVFAGNAPAENATSRRTDPALTDPEEEWEIMVDTVHGDISRRFLSTAEWLDSFFDDERFKSEENRSRMRLYFKNSLIDAEGADIDVHARLRIVLPELEERLSFEVSGDTRDKFEEDPIRSPVDRETYDRDENGLTAGLRYLVRGTDRLNLQLSSGLRIRDYVPVFYLEPRHRFTRNFVPWTLRLTQRVRWYSDDGWEPRSRIDLERMIFQAFFRSTAEVKWYERKTGIFYNIDFAVSRPLNLQSAVELQWNNRFETRPRHRLDTTYFQLRYRQRIWREWLSFEIAPQLAFPEDRDFHPTLGIFFSLNAVFGYTGP